LVAVGGFWFIPATKIAAFWAFLLGVCVVASGLTFLETVANPYTTVLGPPRYAATRINLAQSCNGVGWILGPIAGTLFFYGKDTSGHNTGSLTLWIPYAGVAVAVLILAVMFFFAPVPDVKGEDDYNIEGNDDNAPKSGALPVRKVNRGLSYCLLLGNIVALFSVFNMIAWLALNSLGVGAHLVGFASALPHPAKMAITAETALFMTFIVADGVALVLSALWLIGFTKRLTHHSIWSHEHFSGATLTQFLYVAAQCGIFSFFINYITSEPPTLPSTWLKGGASNWIEVRTTLAGSDFKDISSLATKLHDKADPLSAYLASNLSETTLQTLVHYKQGLSSDSSARVAIMQDLNSLILKTNIYSPERFAGITLQEAAKGLLAQEPKSRNEARLNRLLLADAYPNELSYHDGIIAVTNKFAATLASVAFGWFLLGRLTGAALLRCVSAHKIVGLYSMLNVLVCCLIFLKLGWLSVFCVFLSYFLMSISFPTIFALGIFGLGARAKGASAFIVMGIVGGALLPKVMGAIADHYDMSRGFIVPMVCFALIALYGYAWPKLSRVESLHGVGTRAG
jgi:fucose permease